MTYRIFFSLILMGTLFLSQVFMQAPAFAQENTSAQDSLVKTPAVQASLAAKTAGEPVQAQKWMVSAANPLAAAAGAKVLRGGGTAADAMVAVQTVLGLVEPQSSGLGGGAFLVWYDAQTEEVTTLDARETAPLLATPDLFQNDQGEPLKFYDAVVGGRSVGTPGTPMLLVEAHKRWGVASWASLFEDAIALAEDGFTVSPRLAELVQNDAERLSRFKQTRDYFLPNGTPLVQGELLVNLAYADTLKRLVAQGSQGFYQGTLAQDIVAAVRSAPANPGLLSAADLARYTVKERPAVCVDYRGYDVCGMGPPSSGGLTVGQILGLLRDKELASMGPDDTQTWRLIGDASRLAFADRGRYMADSDFVPVPTLGLLEASYLAQRAALLSGERALQDVEAGSPAFHHAGKWSQDTSIEFPSTSHISIVDAQGNALSMTTTIENVFGSRLMTNGFLLNNELTDFSFRTQKDGIPIANRVEPGKRPRSSMSPTIVLKNGAPILVVGSPGGSRIIGYVAKTIIAYLDWGMNVQQALTLPHAVNRFGTYDLEEGTAAVAMEDDLVALGYKVTIRALTSGLHAIAVGDRLEGAADPRREGIALGE